MAAGQRVFAETLVTRDALNGANCAEIADVFALMAEELSSNTLGTCAGELRALQDGSPHEGKGKRKVAEFAILVKTSPNEGRFKEAAAHLDALRRMGALQFATIEVVQGRPQVGLQDPKGDVPLRELVNLGKKSSVAAKLVFQIAVKAPKKFSGEFIPDIVEIGCTFEDGVFVLHKLASKRSDLAKRAILGLITLTSMEDQETHKLAQWALHNLAQRRSDLFEKEHVDEMRKLNKICDGFDKTLETLEKNKSELFVKWYQRLFSFLFFWKTRQV